MYRVFEKLLNNFPIPTYHFFLLLQTFCMKKGKILYDDDDDDDEKMFFNE